jgi:UPF0755 protein
MARRGGCRKKTALLLFLSLVIAALLVVIGFILFYMQGSGPLTSETLARVKKGTGVSGIASTLEGQGVIRHPLLFRIGYYAYYPKTSLKAGEYLLPAGATPLDVLEKLAKGEVYERVVTVPEGFSALQVMAAINSAEGLEGEKLTTIKEGTVLPETYQYIAGETYAELLARMQAAHTEAVNKLWENRGAAIPVKNLEQAIALASVVEKETGVASERPEVAAVFTNRLTKGMPLQSDPTVIYAITGGLPLGRALSRRDLDETISAYNTYKNAGLPPGPICNPGIESIKAVLNPPSSDYLYFVADGKGGHVFAKTLDEHNRNVRLYKLELSKQRAAAKAAAAAPAAGKAN